MNKFYVVMMNSLLCRLNEDRHLVPAEEGETGALFDDYDQARNAQRRTMNALGKRAEKFTFETVRLEPAK